jgi:hypothetical protein
MKQYETCMIWCGNTYYDTTEQKGKRFFIDGKTLYMEMIDYPFHLMRIDNKEHINVKLFSSSPLIWSENDDLFIEDHSKTSPSLQQLPQKKQCTKQPRSRGEGRQKQKEEQRPLQQDPAAPYQSLLKEFLPPVPPSQAPSKKKE